MSEGLYKMLYEASKEESSKSQREFFYYVLGTLEADLGTNFWDFIDFVILDMLKSVVEALEETNDKFETPDNKARDLSAAYRMVEYFSPQEDYKKFVLERKDVQSGL